MSNLIVGNSHWWIAGNWSNNIGTTPSHVSVSLSHLCSPMHETHEGPASCSTSLMLLLGTVPCWNIWISAVDEFWQVRRWLLIWNHTNQRCLQWSFYKQKNNPGPRLLQYSFSVSTTLPSLRFDCTTEAESRAVEGGEKKVQKKKTNRNRSHVFCQQFVSAAERGGFGNLI